MLAACTLSRFADSYWSARFGTFLQVSALLLTDWRTVQILRQRQKKMTSTAPTTLSAMQAASKSTFTNAQLYSIVNCGNDKNLLSLFKLAVTGRNMLMAL
jgi:hypothetical protein